MLHAMERLPQYPFAGRYYAHPNGLKQHYLDEGTGPPVVMVHGNPSWSYLYRRVVLGLSDRHRCLVPDHIGMGWSDKPDDRQYRYRLDQRLADFTAWLDHVEPTAPIHLIVHDWGGMIGLAWAVRHPERVARLVILNTAAFPMLPGKRLPWTLALVRNTALGAFLVLRLNAFAVGATRFGVVQPLPAEVRRAFVAPYARPAQRIATLRFVQDIPLGPDDPSYATVDATGAALGRLADKPTLICWGLKDFVFDADYLAEFRRRFPSAQVHAFERAGHYLLEDEHERIVPLIRRFLS